jgi:hypothetical protein
MDSPDRLRCKFPVPGSDSSFVVGGGFSTPSFYEKPRSDIVAPLRTWNWNRNLEPKLALSP